MRNTHFEYYRFHLTNVTQISLFHVPDRKRSRKELVKEIFSQGRTYTFQYRKSDYGFVIKGTRNEKAFGWIGKKGETTLHSPPSDGFQKRQVENWPVSLVLVNLDDEKATGKTVDSGQIIAFQVNRAAIINPKNCLRALADEINKKILDSGYHMTINPIHGKKENFWSVVDNNQGKIKKVVLIYTPPNLFDLKNSLAEDLRQANLDFNTTSTQFALENKAGGLKLPKDNELLKESAQYIDQGGGGYQIHVKGGKTIITSEAGVKTETFEGTELSVDGVSDENFERVIEIVIHKIRSERPRA